MSTQNVLAGLSPHAWDAIVIGAGPAGTVASYLLAREGLKTLLVDAKAFPRDKVCGGCMNSRAIATLKQVGLLPALEKCQPAEIGAIEIMQGSRSCYLNLPRAVGVSRAVLDQSLAEAAREAGATFVPETRAQVLPVDGEPVRHVRLTSKLETTVEAAKIVVACDGLGRSSLRPLSEEVKSHTHRASHIGLGAVFEGDRAGKLCPNGRIRMIVAREGYVGLARCEQSRVCLAAAVQPEALAEAGSPARLLGNLLGSAGVDAKDALSSPSNLVQGTLPLTQRPSSVAAQRLLLVGDSAGYVEPFTGEGMAAAIAGATAVAPLAVESVKKWRPSIADAWRRTHRRRVGSRYRTCRLLTGAMRYPWLVRLALAGIQLHPQLANSIANKIATPESYSQQAFE